MQHRSISVGLEWLIIWRNMHVKSVQFTWFSKGFILIFIFWSFVTILEASQSNYLLYCAGYTLKIWQSLSLSNSGLSLWNSKDHYRAHKSPQLDPILSQPNPVRPIDSYLPKVHLNVILPPTSRSSQWSLTFGPPNQNPVNTPPLPHACYMSRPPHPPWFNCPNNIRWRIQAVKFIIMQFSPQSVFLPFRSHCSYFWYFWLRYI
jgi:hypothetical protein